MFPRLCLCVWTPQSLSTDSSLSPSLGHCLHFPSLCCSSLLFFIFKSLNLFIFSCAGSALLGGLSSSCGRRGPLQPRGSGVSLEGAGASVAAAPGLLSTDNNCSLQPCCSTACGILPAQGPNPHLLPWLVGSSAPSQQGSPPLLSYHQGRAGCSEDTAAAPLLTAPQAPQISDRVGGGPWGRACDLCLPSPQEQDGSCTWLLSPREAFPRCCQSTAAFCAWTACSGTPSGSREN